MDEDQSLDVNSQLDELSISQKGSTNLTETKKSSKKKSKDAIRLQYQPDLTCLPRYKLLEMVPSECDEFEVGDLVWVKTGKYPWWPCMITVDPTTGTYSQIHSSHGKEQRIL